MARLTIKVNGRNAIIERETDEELFASLDQAREKYGADGIEVTGAEFNSMQPVGPQQSDRGTGVLGAGVQGASQGATFGFGDEISAGVNQMFMGDQPVQLSEGIREQYGIEEGPSNYEILRDEIRGGQRAAQEESPWAYGIGETVGAIGASAPLMATAGSAGLAGRAGKHLGQLGPRALAGLGEGALYGYGVSEGDSGFRDALTGGGIGAGLAAIAPPALRAVGRGIGHVASRIGQEIFETGETEARRHIQRALARDEVTGDVAEELVERTGGQGMLADLSEETAGLAETVAQRPGGGRQIVSDAMEERVTGMQGRMSEVVEDTVNPTWPEDYAGLRRTLSSEKRTQATPHYERAYNSSLNAATPELQALLNKGGHMKSAIAKARKLMESETPVHGGTVELLDYTGRALSDMATAAYRAGNGNEARIIRNLKRALDDELYKTVPDLRRARNIYAGASQLEDAAEMGRNLLTGKKQYLDEVTDLMTDYTPSQVDAFRIGAIRGIQDRIEDADVTHNATKRLLNSTRVRKLLRVAFPDEESSETFLMRMAGEDEMMTTRNRALHGSPTARREMQNVDMQSIGEVGHTAMDIKSGGAWLAVRKIMGWLSGNKELTDEGAQALAELITSPASREAVEDLTGGGRLRLPTAPARSSPGPIARGATAGAIPWLTDQAVN